ncbi:MAG: tRNA uridine-5-carboxymethylaminomethyl(34) synthesis GTPase MnmE [Candidatus Spyradosoma sp.]
MTDKSTIAAFATPLTESAIIVLRVSGPISADLVRGIFRTESVPEPRRCRHGFYRTLDGEIADDCLYVFFEGASSYTGEDSLEICCHGNPFIAKKIFSDLVARGCREALPGEFTRRAFLNGKMDLTQAEAVADVIAARSEASLKAARRLLAGTFGKMISEWSEEIMSLIAELESQIDFSDEEVPDFENEHFRKRLDDIIFRLKNVENSARYSAAVHDGISAVIFGAPNAGKSSLMNVLLGEERALVSPEAGTTRDFITENFSVGEYRLRISDTAGLRGDAESEIEKAGIRRSTECMKKADVLIFVVDSSEDFPEISGETKALMNSENTLVVFNKSDLTPAFEGESALPGFARVSVSLLDASAREIVTAALVKMMKEKEIVPRGDVLVVSARHAEFLRRAGERLYEAAEKLGSVPPEFVVSDLRNAAEELSEILGRFDDEKVLDKIFSSFCIGK